MQQTHTKLKKPPNPIDSCPKDYKQKMKMLLFYH